MYNKHYQPHVDEAIRQVILDTDPILYARIKEVTFIPIDTLIRPQHKANKIPRLTNAYLLYRRNFQAKLKVGFGAKISMRMTFISKEASKSWKTETDEIKNIYSIIAEMAIKVHKKMYPSYLYKSKRLNFTINTGIMLSKRDNDDDLQVLSYQLILPAIE